MINGKQLGDVGFQYLGVPYSQMDCQAFVEKCLADCGLKINLTGSNAWYREVMKNGEILTPEECTQRYGTVPKGAFLFIHSFNGGEPDKYRKDGLGNASHIGIVTMPRGEGAIHSSFTKDKVCESKFQCKTIKNGGWNKVGLWNKVDYDVPDVEPLPPDEPSLPTLRKGDKGQYVTLLQTKLIQLGYDLPKWGADGDFGTETYNAVIAFQSAYNLAHPDNPMEIDGVVGRRTWDALLNSVTTFYTVTIRHVAYDVADAIVKQYGGELIAERG